METYLQTVKEEWVKLINETDPDVHRLATELARDNAMPWSLDSIVLCWQIHRQLNS